MKAVFRGLLLSFIAASFPAAAQEPCGLNGSTTNGQDSSSQSLTKIVQYLQNLGSYLGFDVTNAPSSIDAQLLEPTQDIVGTGETGSQNQYQILLNTFIGAIPVNPLLGTSLTPVQTFLTPGGAGLLDYLNDQANKVFTSYSGTSGSISANPLLDQPMQASSTSATTGSANFQSDPVNQAIVNILGTPDASNCVANGDVKKDCNILTQDLVTLATVGIPKSGSEFFKYENFNTAVPQLNSNSLTGPMLYQQNSGGGGASSVSPTGIAPQDQGQQAANFIRFVTGSVTPLPLATNAEYSTYFNIINNKQKTALDKAQATAVLTNYLASLRVYAAQLSVGFSNLYYMLEKRLPQNQGGSGSATNNTSQAVTEFNMATWRIFNPATGQATGNQQWLQQINTASPTTVQKEIAILLAEMNYQLYLNRQQEERILLTNTILLIQNAKAAQPSISSTATNNQAAAASGASTSGGGN